MLGAGRRHLDRDAAVRRRAPGVKLTECGVAITDRLWSSRGAGVGGVTHARVGRAPQLANEQHLAGRDVIARRAGLSRSCETSDEPLMGGPVELVELDLDSYHPFHTTRADLLRRLDRSNEVAAAPERAADLAPAGAERDILRRGGRGSR